MRIVNFGSLNLDMVYRVSDFVRPGQTISDIGLSQFCGGKGLNQSIAAARAGAQVVHAGAVGNDGKPLIDCLASSGVSVEHVNRLDEPSGHAIIQVNSDGQNCIIVHGGANVKLSKEYIDKVMDSMDKGDIVLVQNETNNIPYIMQSAHRHGMKIAFNPSPITDEVDSFPLELVSWFILNEIEGGQIAGQAADPETVLNLIAKKYPNSAVVLTLGGDGVVYKDPTQSASHGIYSMPVVDTTAAGDTFCGYFLASCAAGQSVERSLDLASKAAGLAVSRAGAEPSIPLINEVLRL